MYKQNNNLKTISLIMIIIGLVSLLVAFLTDAHSAWVSLLFNNYDNFGSR